MVLVLVYSVALISFVGFSNLFMTFLGLELLSWLFVLMLTSSMALPYLVVQSYFIFTAILLSLSPLFLLWILVLKMGLPPFHNWLLSLFVPSSINVLMFMLLLHKFLPLAFFSKVVPVNILLIVSSLIMVFSMVLMFQLSGMYQVLMISSMIHSIWMVIGLLFALSFFLVYWVIYSLLTMMMVFSLKMKLSFKLIFNQGWLTFFTWLVISGIPPFSIFWLKAELISWMIFSSAELIGWLFIMSSILSLSMYYRISHLSSNKTDSSMETSPPLLVVSSVAPLLY